MGGEITVPGEALTGGARVLLAVEMENRLAQAEIAGGPGVGAGEVARQEPLRGPFSDSREGDQARLHVLV